MPDVEEKHLSIKEFFYTHSQWCTNATSSMIKACEMSQIST